VHRWRSNSRLTEPTTCSEKWLRLLHFRAIAGKAAVENSMVTRCANSGRRDVLRRSTAESRHLEEGVDEKRLLVAARLEKVITSFWSAGVEHSEKGAAKIVLRALADYSRLYGLDAAMQLHVRPRLSEAEFAAQARQLLEVTGPPCAEARERPWASKDGLDGAHNMAPFRADQPETADFTSTPSEGPAAAMRPLSAPKSRASVAAGSMCCTRCGGISSAILNSQRSSRTKRPSHTMP
jgi:hypothetical protein